MQEYVKLAPFLMLLSLACGGPADRAAAPSPDAADAGSAAASQTSPADAGAAARRDGGSTPRDGGTVDAGSQTADAGVADSPDAGVAGSPDAGAAGSPDAGSTGTADAGTADAGTPAAQSCLTTPLLQKLGKTQLLVGADMSDGVAESAPFDVRYLYLSGGLADGNGTCSSCASGCTSAGASCANTAGCGWWACWQNDALAPGQYVRDLVTKTAAKHQLPMITYYELLQSSGVTEGSAEVTVAANDRTLMTRLFNDWRLVLQQIGSSPALLHVEPDFWGYAEKVNPDPHAQPAAVASANPTDCGGQENSIAGMARCLIAMARKYAPNAKVGLHASSWGSNREVMQNKDPSLDVAAAARDLADFLLACGAADGDFIGMDLADRDAGYERSLGNNTFWDPTNRTLPNFTQAFTWAQALTERMHLPGLWWQVPLGNMSLPDVNTQWQDNRVDYFFSHTADVAKTNAFGMMFGAGEVHQTSPSTDNGNFVARTNALSKSGGQAACF